jgi:hypothetical protein
MEVGCGYRDAGKELKGGQQIAKRGSHASNSAIAGSLMPAEAKVAIS